MKKLAAAVLFFFLGCGREMLPPGMCHDHLPPYPYGEIGIDEPLEPGLDAGMLIIEQNDGGVRPDGGLRIIIVPKPSAISL